MNNNRERILNLVKNNIVNKLRGRGSSFEDKKQLLERELLRNSSLFLDDLSNREIAIEERDFILAILKELNWSVTISNERLERLEEVINGTIIKKEKPKYKISEEKLLAFQLEKFNRASDKINEEIQSIKARDAEEGAFYILYSRLKDIESAKGCRWGKEEIEFVIEKRNMGYSFKAIATILKRPERVVMMKYHQNK